MAVASWVLLANLIDKYHFPTSPVQNAVWVLSNGHDIRSITPIRGRPTIRLRECVADILEIDLPWYSYGYMDSEDSTELFSGVKDKIVAEVPFSVPRRTMITGQIKDKSGNLLYQSASYHANRGENVYFLEADIHDWAIGEYDFYLMEDFGTLNQKRSFTVVADEIIEPEGGLDEGLIIDG
jgi:hypothetical protein